MQQEAGKSMPYACVSVATGGRQVKTLARFRDDPGSQKGGRQAAADLQTDSLVLLTPTHTHTEHTHTQTDTPMSLWVEQEALSAGGAFLSPQLGY
jgi:hypothetical protein